MTWSCGLVRRCAEHCGVRVTMEYERREPCIISLVLVIDGLERTAKDEDITVAIKKVLEAMGYEQVEVAAEEISGGSVVDISIEGGNYDGQGVADCPEKAIAMAVRRATDPVSRRAS